MTIYLQYLLLISSWCTGLTKPADIQICRDKIEACIKMDSAPLLDNTKLFACATAVKIDK